MFDLADAHVTPEIDVRRGVPEFVSRPRAYTVRWAGKITALGARASSGSRGKACARGNLHAVMRLLRKEHLGPQRAWFVATLGFNAVADPGATK